MAAALSMPSSSSSSSLSHRRGRRVSSILYSSSSFMGKRIALRSSTPMPKLRTAPTSTAAAATATATTICNSVLIDVAKDVMIQPVEAPTMVKPTADPRSVASIILGGGAGTRLFPLTQKRAKPAVPIGGCYRLIDIPMSNCINSGINRIYVLTQFNSHSLNRHIAKTYNFTNSVVEVLAATQTPGEFGDRWFQGTADAVRRFAWLFEDAKLRQVENIVILSGDHLYRMDYMDFVQKHIDTGADITVSCVPTDDSRACDFGLVKIDETGRIEQFLEKPKGESLKTMQVDTTVLGLSPQDANKYKYIASMGIYVFRTSSLLRLLRLHYPTANDFGSEVIPKAVKDYNVQAYLFDGYWEDIGTIKSFFDANLALTDQCSKFHFYDPLNPIITSPRYLPPTKIDKCKVVDSIVSHGCFLTECSIEHSVVGLRSRLEPGVQLKDTVMMGADYYQTEQERSCCLAAGNVPLGIGENTKIRNCIIDKNAGIGKNVIIANLDNVEEADRPSEGFYIRSGITVIPKNAVISDGTII
ncbi:Glucose-1-phosphate adenylyltransferase large subunit 2, chloroplastic [Ananas comosus]|uniref:Glucose-1-phosphate adenylyltransferase n=1 Tax=Ananas comosus TaxID=4615 RepID=A0A199UHZ8_ANACO|nr:Glucose-1-phosphate adenylyltransferase large subunit 2, chloroplastic [Ananas comosus]